MVWNLCGYITGLYNVMLLWHGDVMCGGVVW